MKESYNLVLSSQNSSDRLGSNKRNFQYNIVWGSILPIRYDTIQKYKVRFSFTSLVQSSFAELYSLNIDFGGSNTYDQSCSRSTFVGYLLPYFSLTNAAALATGVTGTTQTAFFYLQAKPDDNSYITIDYPTNNVITVNIVNLSTVSTTTFNSEYILNLEFTPI